MKGFHAEARDGGDEDTGSSQSIVLRLRLIGPMAAWTLEPQSVLPPGRKTRALLAVLAMSMPRGVSRARLAEMLWSGRPDEQSRASLRQELHRLQEALAATGADLLQVNRDQVALRPGMVWLDTEELLGATTERPAALVLMDRDLLEGMEGIDSVFDQWLAEQRDRLRSRARDLAEGLLADTADPDTAMMAAQRLLSIDNAHEGAWRAMIRGFALRGEHGMAIQSFERCKAALAEHLGAVPSPETARLVMQLRGVTGFGEAPSSPPASVQPAEPIVSAAVASPRVGVLPPRLVGEGTAMLPVAIGLADEITAALTRFRWFNAVSSAAMQRCARAGEDERSIRAALGIDYLLDGTLQHAGHRVRLGVRLIDLTAEQQVVWVDRFDADVADVFAMQDRLSAEISARVDVALLAAEARRGAANPARSTAHLAAVPLMMRFERADFDRAGVILRDALVARPDRSDVWGWFSFWHLLGLLQDWEPDPQAGASRALTLAVRAQALDPLDARGVMLHGLSHHLLYHQPREALVLYERAQLLNPNLPGVWALAGLAHAHLGALDQADRNLAESERLAPLSPVNFLCDAVCQMLAVFRKEFERAIEIGRSLIELHPTLMWPYVYQLSALGHAGRQEEAARVTARLRGMKRAFGIGDLLRYMGSLRDQDRALILAGLKKLGIPN